MKLSIYQFTEYKDYINQRIELLPKSGFGEFKKIADNLNVSTTIISQIFRGDKQLSLELAVELCDYLGLEEDEVNYFLLLVESARAGSYKLKKRFSQQIKLKQSEAKKLETRVKNTVELTEEAKSIFYSSWLYSAVRILTDLPQINDPTTIAQRLQIQRTQAEKILEFLLEHKLVLQVEEQLKPGPTLTHLKSSNHLVAQHHQNWRLLAMNKVIQADRNAFHFTGPMTMSLEVAEQIRALLPEFVEGVVKRTVPSIGEGAFCLNIDWFEL